MIKVWIRPREKYARRVIYDDLTKLGMSREEAKEKLKNLGIFLSKGEIKKRGRPPKYDFLQIFIGGISHDMGNTIKEYLERKLKRPVFLYPKNESYVFIAPWRNAEGETLPYDILFFRKLKDDIERISKGENLEVLTSTSWREDYEKLKKGKEEIPHDMEKTIELKRPVQEEEKEIFHDMGKEGREEEKIPEKVREYLSILAGKMELEKEERRLRREKNEKLLQKTIREIRELEEKRGDLKRELEMMGGFFLLSKKRKMEKELKNIELELRRLRAKRDYLRVHPEATEEDLKKWEIDYTNEELEELLDVVEL